MNFRFQDSGLEDLYYLGKGASKLPDFIVRAFFRKVQFIKNAKNENDLRALKGNHFEKMEGKKNLYSIRLNDQYRLEFALDKSDGTTIIVQRISNHYS